MADESRIAISECFVSQDKNKLRENIQKVMDEYISLLAKGCDFPAGEEGEE